MVLSLGRRAAASFSTSRPRWPVYDSPARYVVRVGDVGVSDIPTVLVPTAIFETHCAPVRREIRARWPAKVFGRNPSTGLRVKSRAVMSREVVIKQLTTE